MSKFSTGSATLAIRFKRFAHLPRRALALATALPLVVLLAMPHGAGAQEAYSQGAPLDPPGSVARLNLTEGAVSFAAAEANAEANAWTPAVLNRPLTTGDRLWTGRRARSELHVGSTAVRMSEQTSLDFLALDDDLTQLRLAQGSAQLRVRTLFEGQRLEVDTPNLAFVIAEPGEYRVDVNPASNTTRVVALSGSGVLYGDNGAVLNLGRQQQGNFSGTQLSPAAPGPAVQDNFDAWAAARDRREDRSDSARYIPRETIGYQQLDSYGDWQQDPSYGAVWLPRAVPVNWAPYRAGHWSWISPWGWTWVDDAPWGFAPFHYGRWAQIGPRWAWVPGHLPQRPVYAPALVAFVGGSSSGSGINWNISVGSGGAPQPGVGWFPLAPGEAFRPVYRASPRYITQVNNNIVVNNTVNITNNYRFQHQPAAVTAVNRDDFFRGRPLQGHAHALSAADLGRAQVLVDRSAMPQRPDMHERPRLAPAAALPPAAVALQPMVRSREERGNDRHGVSERIDPRAARLENNERNPRAQAAPAAPPPPQPAAALPPALRPLAAPAPERNAGEAEQRVRREQQQRDQRELALKQTEQVRQQGELTRQHDMQRRQNEAQQAQQQNQRDQQRQQAEQARAQHAQREQAQKQTEQVRQQGELTRQHDMQRGQNEAQQQEQRRHQAEAAQGQRIQREQAQRQQEQVRQQQRTAQQEQRSAQAQERQKPAHADAADERAPRPEGERRRHREP